MGNDQKESLSKDEVIDKPEYGEIALCIYVTFIRVMLPVE
jgi:hypothetical protein